MSKILNDINKKLISEGMPCSIDSENAVLSILINDKTALEILTENHIENSHFHSTISKNIFTECKNLVDDGYNIDAQAVIEKLRQKYGEKKIREIVLELFEANYLMQDFQIHLHNLKLYHYKRDIIIQGYKMIQSAYTNNLKIPIEQQKKNYIDGEELAEMKFTEPKYIIPDILVEGLTLFAGKPKLGKSIVMLNIAIAVASGGYALGKIHVKKRFVLFCSLEDTARRLQKRLKIMLKDDSPPNMGFLFSLDRENIKTELEKYVKKNKDIGMVIIDTLAKIKKHAKKGSDIYMEDYEIIAELKTIADRHNIAIVIIHHTSKGKKDDIFETVLGTTGLIGAADSVIIMKKERGQADGYLHIIGKDIEDQELAMQFDTEILSWKLLGDAKEYKNTQESQEIIDIISNRKTPIAAKEIVEITGKTKQNINNILRRLVEKSQISQPMSGFYARI